MLTIGDVLQALSDTPFSLPGCIITDAAIDSRMVIPCSLFIALPGEKKDGHEFIADAFKRGACLALVQRDIPPEFQVIDLRSGTLPENFTLPDQPFCLRVEDSLASLQNIARYWRRQLNLRVVGITGSVGKSTTKELVSDVLSQRFHTIKNQGNFNNEIGLPLTILRLSRGTERAVLEMGFYTPGEITFLCDIALPQTGIVTNIGTVHAERAGSQETIARGKGELIQALPPAPIGTAILNFDDPWVRPMTNLTEASILSYGLTSQSDLWADGIESQGLEGIRFRLHYQNEVLHLHVPLIGRHSVHTVLRAAATGLSEGLTWGEIIHGLQTGHNQLRLSAVRTTRGALLLDDTYNASPESTLAALNLLGELGGRKIAVLGDMLELGPYEIQGHSMVGARAAEVVESLVTVGERGSIIARAAQQSGLSIPRITSVDDVQQAIDYLKDRLDEGDVVLIKGSHGLHMDRIVSALEEER